MTTNEPKMFNMANKYEISPDALRQIGVYRNNYDDYWLTGCCAARFRPDIQKVVGEHNEGFVIVPRDTEEQSTDQFDVVKIQTKSGMITIGARNYGTL